MSTPTADVVVIGAGIVGASIAYHATLAGLRVTVVEQSTVAGGTSSACEGNILLSDKHPGPELDLAIISRRRWEAIGDEIGAEAFEFDHKGGVVVAGSEAGMAALRNLSRRQAEVGVEAEELTLDALHEREPRLSRDVAGAVWYPQDAQVQPMLATAQMLRAARAQGATMRLGTAVTGFLRGGSGEVRGVTTDASDAPDLAARWVVNASGARAGEVAALAGSDIPILPRRGFILVTEPLPRAIRHKVYSADYVANVASSAAGLETSLVVEGTHSGTILIGASRERVGFDRTYSVPVLQRLAQQAIGLFPFLADVALLRTYLGFRPYCPDHLPVIGEDPAAPGLLHAAGHEGAGIGLSAATGLVLAQVMSGAAPEMDLAAFNPGRFAEAAA